MEERFKYIKTVRINDFLDNDKDKTIYWELNQDVNILAGHNGIGKSTILQLISGTIQQYFETDFLYKSCVDTFVILCIYLKHTGEEVDGDCLSYTNDKEKIESFIESETIVNTSNGEVDLVALREQVKISNKGIFSNLGKVCIPKPSNKKQPIGIRIDEIHAAESLEYKIHHLEREYKNYQDKVTLRYAEILERNGSKDDFLEASHNQIIFEELIDKYFKSSSKKIQARGTTILFKTKNKKRVSINNLSSGEKYLLTIFITALVQDNENSVLIIDNPETFLHTDWQRDLITDIRKLNPNVQLIIATHSPAMVMNGWQDKIFQVEDLLITRRDRKDD